MCLQVALDVKEGTAPSSSQPQLGQGISDASNSDSTAGPRKVKHKRKAPAPAAQLLEDEGLNAELDAAYAGGLVETERDRLIRTVSQLSTHAHAEGYLALSCILCHACVFHFAAAAPFCQGSSNAAQSSLSMCVMLEVLSLQQQAQQHAMLELEWKHILIIMLPFCLL